MSKRFSLSIRDHIYTPEGKLKYNKSVFAEIAAEYDYVTGVLSFSRDQRWKQKLVDKLGAMEEPRCLDLACGTGHIAFKLARKYPGASILGLDVTEAMVIRARARNKFSNVTFELGDMTETGLPDASVDIITAGYALRNAAELDKAIAEVWRLLKPGGTAAVLDFSKPANAFGQKIEFALLKTWGGLWGLLLHRNPEVYTYIVASLKQFPDSAALKRKLARSGLEPVWSKKHFFGFAESIICQKSR